MHLSRVLVDVDAAAPHHPALAAAIDIAARAGAALTIVDVIAHVPRRARRFVTSAIESELVAHRGELLAAIAADIRGVQVSTSVLRGRPATALVEEVRRGRHDLLVRSHVRDQSDRPRPFGSVDMELLRQCPCPVWLIGPTAPSRCRRVLATVHSASDDDAEAELNRRILELALDLRDLETAELTVLEAWSLFGEDLLRPRLTDDDLRQALDETRTASEQRLHALVSSFGDRAAGVTLEVVKGLAEDVIPEYVEAHGVDVVVMGTVARSGVAGLVMGNTAEHVLQRLRGSVLAVKPPRFVSPVPAPDADPWVARRDR